MSLIIPHEQPASKRSSGPHPSRRQARQFALQLLFQFEFHHSFGEWVEEFWTLQTVTSETREFSDYLVQGVHTNKESLDYLISQYAVEWTLERMPVVDRNILRCALFELFWMNDIPAIVTVNEAVELAKRFADDETKRFVNAMLDHILQSEPRLQEKRTEIANQKHEKPSNSEHSASNVHEYVVYTHD